MESNVISLGVVGSRRDHSDGTFPVCSTCPSQQNCCSRVRPKGGIDPPLLFPDDVAAIEKFTQQPAESFTRKSPARSPNQRLMLTGPGGCHFYRDGKCSIYAVRPIDCRLFPYDIIEQPDGCLAWIVYTALCPATFDPRWHFDEAERLLRRLGDNLLAYAQAETPTMEGEPYIVLGNVSVSSDLQSERRPG